LYYYFSHLISISLYFCAPINNGDKTAKTESLKHRVASGRVKATRHYHPRWGRQSAQTAAAAKLVVFLRCGSSSLARSGSISLSLYLSLQLQLRSRKIYNCIHRKSQVILAAAEMHFQKMCRIESKLLE
jgi:hypothetical protein